MWLLHLLGATVIRSVKCLSNQNLISQDKQFKHSSESIIFYTMEQFGHSSNPDIISHNEAF